MAGICANVLRPAGSARGRLLIPLHVWKSGLETSGDRVSWDRAARRMPAILRSLYIHTHTQPNCSGRHRVRAGIGAVDSELDHLVWKFGRRSSPKLLVDCESHGQFLARRNRHERPNLLHFHDLFGFVPDSAFAGINAVESING